MTEERLRDWVVHPETTADVPDRNEVAAGVEVLRARAQDGSMQLFGPPMEDPVLVEPPGDAWPERFRATRIGLAEALGPTARRIDHVGSTAVPGIAAKPILDIQISVVDLDEEAAYVPQIEALGWPLRLREAEQRFFREPGSQQRTTHIHVCRLGGDWEARHLLFRDYLRANPRRAAEYAALKLALAERYRHDRVAYTEAKGPFIEATTADAEQWALETGWHV